MTTEVGGRQVQPWTPDASTFGARLALVRQHMGWGNVKEAADACGLPAENWRRWERDGIEPRRLTTIAMTIATKTGCDYIWLCHGPGWAGSPRPTTGFATTARVLATVGEDSPGRRSRTSGPATRPVRQTRPMRGAVRRPVTPVAV